jgi:branched-chain amino acid transport system permease protein
MRPLVRWALVAVAAVALVTFPYWSSGWESTRFATTLLRDGLILAIFALSLDLLVGRAGMPSLGHAAFYGAGGYAAGIASQRLGTDELAVTLGAAAVVAALLALLIGVLVVRSEGIFFLMLTLALAQIVFAIAFQWTAVTGGSNGLSGVGRPMLATLDFSSPDLMYVLVASTFVVAAIVVWGLARSPYGRALVGVRENERRMRALGYDTARLRLSAFVLAGTIAGIAGALSAYSTRFVSAQDAGLGNSVRAFVTVLVGGAGTLGGPIAGSALVSLIERVVPSLLPPELRISEAILGLVFIAFVLFARQGMVGLGRHAWLRMRAR